MFPPVASPQRGLPGSFTFRCVTSVFHALWRGRRRLLVLMWVWDVTLNRNILQGRWLEAR